MDWKKLKEIGVAVYKLEDWKDKKRYLVFLARCWLNQKAVGKHLDFLTATPLRRKMLQGTPQLLDQATRQIFYKNSTIDERVHFVQEHITLMEELFTPELLEKVYLRHERLPLWRIEFQNKPLWLYIGLHDGQQKEGCISLEIVHDTEDLQNFDWGEGRHLYQIVFAMAKNDEGELYIRVGALQGLANGLDLIKDATKTFFGYRPKNLMFWCLRSFAETIGAKYITAVSNRGYYAMNHFRLNRKLKVDLNEFWEEAGGRQTSDYRFYRLEIGEYRKDMSELKPSKRAQHRRRFEFLDNVKATIKENLQKYLR